MPDDTVRVLRCLVKGTTIPMKVSPSVDDDVDDFKAMVHQRGKNGILRDTDIQDLFVWKLKNQESLIPEESLSDRVFSQGHLSTIAVKLESSARIGDIFKDQPKLGLHIVVQHVPFPQITPSGSADSNLSSLADDQLKLFCWVHDASGNPFPVVIGKCATVGELKEEIKKKKENLLGVIDPDTLELWKLSQPIPSTEIRMKVKFDQSPKEIPGSVKLDSGDALSEHFSLVLPKHVHIVVEVPSPARKRNLNDISSHEERGERHKADSSIVDDGPCYANFGFDRLRYDNTPADLVLRFYEQFWGVPLPQEHISLKNSVHDPNDEENDEENGGENGGDVLPATPPPIIDTDWTRLLIRAEYLRIYKWVEDMYEVGKVYRPSAIVVTGQPGIGQSFWAYYVLRRRLGEKRVSLWYQRSVYYLFCSEGVLVVPVTFTFNKFSPRVWTIIDSALSPSGIPSALAHFLPGVFPIYITSPKRERWSGITQSWTSHHVIMNPWTRAEIEYAIILYSNQKLDDVLQRYDS
ncbi:hypothetical protein M378DRAFT_108566, partial [Amanita muscaria Koide BX008]